MVFAIHWHESALDLHVFPILNPPPASLPIPSLWVFPVQQPQHLSHASNLGWWSVSHLIIYMCWCCSLRSYTLGFSHRVQKSVLYICVSFSVLHIGLSLHLITPFYTLGVDPGLDLAHSPSPPPRPAYQRERMKSKGGTRYFPGGASGKEVACQCWRLRRHWLDPWVRKIPWRRARKPTPVFLPGESPWTEEPGGLQSMGSQSRTRLNWLSTQHKIAGRQKWRVSLTVVGMVEGREGVRFKGQDPSELTRSSPPPTPPQLRPHLPLLSLELKKFKPPFAFAFAVLLPGRRFWTLTQLLQLAISSRLQNITSTVRPPRGRQFKEVPRF